MAKDTSKPIRFKTVMKNTKLGQFVAEESAETKTDKQEFAD